MYQTRVIIIRFAVLCIWDVKEKSGSDLRFCDLQ